MQPSTRYSFNLHTFQMEEKTGPLQILGRFWQDTKTEALDHAEAELKLKEARLNRELRDVKEGLYIVGRLKFEEYKKS